MNPLFPPSRAQALSPVSTAGSEWSGINGYSTMPRSQSPFSPQPSQGYPPGRSPMNGVNASPDGLPMGPPGGAKRPSMAVSQIPSPPLSMTNVRSSDGTLSDQQSMKYKRMEDQLAQHYDVLKRFLNGGQQQPPRPNKAQDKLLRLSATQFHELSTDVYDELIRRQAVTAPRPPPGRPPQRPPNVPPYLLPRSDFHEKRNQARQKLSSLQPQRFRDLATDVFCELERRFPHFRRMNISRQGSPAANGQRSFSSRGPTPSGIRPSPPSGANSFSGPPRNFHGRGPGSAAGPGFNGQRYPPPEGGPTRSPPGAENLNDEDGPRPESEYGKPIPKQFQSNTITPNKSTMVEDDEDEFAVYDDQYDGKGNAFAPGDTPGNGMQRRRDTSATAERESTAAAKNTLAESQSKVQELNCRVDELQVDLSLKDDEIAKFKEAEQRHAAQGDWMEIKQELEKRLEDAELLNQSMKDQLDRIHTDQANVERDLRAQLDQAKRPQASDGGWKAKHEQLEKEHQALRAKLQDQQRVTEEVRQQASGFLSEMRTMAESGGSNWEREEELGSNVRRLEEQVKEWKSRYASSKAQLRNLRTTSIGLPMSRPDMARYAKANEFTRPDGLVKDIYITKFQIAIDELLRISRSEDPSAVLDHMKTVVLAVRGITHDLDDGGAADADDESVQKCSRLKAKVSATANNVITASKNFASSNGLSPVSLLDAAASHLTTAVVELIREVKIRPTPADELDDEDEEEPDMDEAGSPTYFNVERSHARTVSVNESVYSAVSTPPASAGSSAAHTAPHARSESKSSSDGTLATGYGDANGPGSAGIPLGFGMRSQDDGQLEDLKLYLEDQTDALVHSIQDLVGSIRAEARLPAIRDHMSTITEIVGEVVGATEESMAQSATLRDQVGPVVENLSRCQKRLSNAGTQIESLGDKGRRKEFLSRVPPLAFEIARETKALVQRVDLADRGEPQEQENYS